MADLEEVLSDARTRKRLPSPRTRRLLRERAHLSQRELAMVLGVSDAAVSRWESGLRQPSRRTLTAYVEVLERLADEPREEAA